VEIFKRGNEKISIEKRFSEFDQLQDELKKLFTNLPKLPGKTIFKPKTSEELDARRIGLDKYIKVIFFI